MKNLFQDRQCPVDTVCSLTVVKLSMESKWKSILLKYSWRTDGVICNQTCFHTNFSFQNDIYSNSFKHINILRNSSVTNDFMGILDI